nr:MltA domain-containing protein [Cochlodiniinecator piscidefendens]
MTGSLKAEEPEYTLLSFDELDGWESDDHDAALSTFLNTCSIFNDPEWSTVCGVAGSGLSGRQFFELFFRPVLVEDGDEMLFTGYFEPELSGSRVRTGQYRYPLYQRPREARGRWLTRRQIEETGVLDGRNLEIVYVDDPVEVFFLQIQGSGRIRLTNGEVIRVGYGGANGHPYSSIGSELVRRGVYSRHQVSAQVIQNWVRRNPIDGAELLRHNDSFVFFRELDIPAHLGPIGAMARSITPMRTVAVDPEYTQLGAPIWIEKAGADPLNRLMVAQDTGSAIKGAQRADIFYGPGDDAGRAAGRISDTGRMVVLMPIQLAYRLAPETEE